MMNAIDRRLISLLIAAGLLVSCGKDEEKAAAPPPTPIAETAAPASQPAPAATQPAEEAKPAPKTPEQLGFSPERFARFRQGMQHFVEEGDVAGIVTLVARHGTILSIDVFGKRDLDSGTQMTPDTIFRIYSMTKPVTGVAMMMLYEEGKWQLDDPVAKYIPEFANLKVATDRGARVAPLHAMTMRELMSHSAGFTYGAFGNTPVDALYRKANLFDREANLDDMIDKLGGLPLDYQPGTQWKYSISADIQGYLVEELSGQKLDDFMRSRIFRPLGMNDTGFFAPEGKHGRLAKLYTYDEVGKLTLVAGEQQDAYLSDPSLLSGGGGLVSTASDYMRFCQMLANGGVLEGARILAPSTIKLMRSNQLPAGVSPNIGMTTGFGLDFGIIDPKKPPAGPYGAGTYFWAGAAGTWFWIDPANDLIVVGMVQLMPRTGQQPSVRPPPDIRGASANLIYQALVDPQL